MDAGKFIEEKVEEISSAVGNESAISALSGGVDSSAVTVLGHRALDERLISVFIDTGVMRKNEPEEVISDFGKLGIKVELIDAVDRFFDVLKGVEDGEEKRKIFRDTFYKVFGETVRRFGAKFLLQGTIKPDIEETQAGIKTQHNILSQIGIDPRKEYGFGVVEPLRDLVKWEVREVAKALGLPESRYARMPFLGPGLVGRVIGEVTRERVAIAREANAIVEEELTPLKPFQCFAALMKDMATSKVPGRKGERSYGMMVVVRCVESTDARTAEVTEVPWNTLKKLQKRITDEIPEVTRVAYDITSKPPATIEYI